VTLLEFVHHEAHLSNVTVSPHQNADFLPTYEDCGPWWTYPGCAHVAVPMGL